jgi:aryl-alcohol dehydrogenase-like predicted oxidoreductase
LKTDKLYGYLLHHFEVYKNNPKVWDDFIALKESGKVQKIGFSLYTPEELQFILDNKSPFDLIQVPFNILDKKFLPLMKEVHEKGVEIHVRSTFLQGLFFMDRKALPEKLKPMKKYLLQLDEFSKQSGFSISEIALNYNLQNPYIDGVLIGVDNEEQLKMNLASVKDTPIDIEIEVKEQELLNPVNWN